MPYDETQLVPCEKCGTDALWREGWYKLCFQHFCEFLAARNVKE